MKEYLLKFKGLRYSLKATGYKSLDDDMIIVIVLDRLIPDYKML